MKDLKVVHLTTVHDPDDPRIVRKQCGYLARRGIRVTLVACGTPSWTPPGVDVIDLGPRRGRIHRFLILAFRAVRRAASLRPAIVHLHDPELLFAAQLFRLTAIPVVYDIHEDIRTLMSARPYIPSPISSKGSRIASLIERLFSAGFHKVIAEDYYSERYPRATPVFNYPELELWTSNGEGSPLEFSKRLLYLGNVTADRGALRAVSLLCDMPDYELHFVGRCSAELAESLRTQFPEVQDRLSILGEGRYVAHPEMTQYVRERRWAAGVAWFPQSPHYERKLLTKFYEYSALGLPIIASSFPAWRRFLTLMGNGIFPDDYCAGERARKVMDLLEGSFARSNMRYEIAVRARVYDWTSQGDRLVSLYRKIVARKSSRKEAAEIAPGKESTF